ncbi:Dipeptidyl aminopeptidase/acylaminoacyl peptidase [Chitinophaga sp. YR627]|uniref:S9 family peptidase n=1 Tax=Chitinophaga sp. YR627 TaxID=1881041 RepID=UPI0008E8584D|nr:prolyl oligopeptidase family serine peptidase [Chitinophaga sp. YR627]SFO29593.1 Dipeptidyl aminopeptidase/acylaminoacyl peptidase [Chitinophaga sp. YR627]
MNYARILSAVLIFSFYVGIANAQKDNIFNIGSYKKWPSIVSPILSDDGRFFAYCIELGGSDSMYVVVSSTDCRWEKRIECKKRFFNGVFNKDEFVFAKGYDSICTIPLNGENPTTIGGFGSVDRSEGGKYLILSGDSGIIFKDRNESLHFGNVTWFLELPNTTELMIKGSDSSQALLLHLPSKKRFDTVFICQKFQNIAFDKSRQHLAWSTECNLPLHDSLFVLDIINNKLRAILVPDGLHIQDILGFVEGQSDMVVRWTERSVVRNSIGASDPIIWSSSDEKIGESGVHPQSEHYSIVKVADGHFVQLDTSNDEWLSLSQRREWPRFILLSQTAGNCDFREQFWNKSCLKLWYRIDLRTGIRESVPELNGRNQQNVYEYSPDGKLVVFFDFDEDAYFCYSIESKRLLRISGNVRGESFGFKSIDSLGYLPPRSRGIAGFYKKETVLVYGFRDIWMLDLNGRADPVNLTNNYGSRNDIAFSLLDKDNYELGLINRKLVLSAFDYQTKSNGFYSISLSDSRMDPEKLFMGPYLFYLPFFAVGQNKGMKPIRSSSSSGYIVQREEPNRSPNLFYTRDFKKFKPISSLYPEQKFKWCNTRLVKWNSDRGQTFNGILYIPEDFDPSKKYPIIFNVYEQFSSSLNAFVKPEMLTGGCVMSVLKFTSEGYLVFRPDILYKVNQPGESALKAVESSIIELSRLSFVDSARLGIQGCSFGGYETNYIVSHSKHFKAASSASGGSDVMSWASSKYMNQFTSFSYQQYRILGKFWEDPSPFIANSPLYSAASICTPLLFFHTSTDNAVPFSQAAQLFLTLRRLEMPAWLLQYGGDANHGLTNAVQIEDFSIRMSEFFAFYLIGRPRPKWMGLRTY